MAAAIPERRIGGFSGSNPERRLPCLPALKMFQPRHASGIIGLARSSPAANSQVSSPKLVLVRVQDSSEGTARESPRWKPWEPDPPTTPATLAGPSGCGKSTLLSLMGLLDSPTDGSYLLKPGGYGFATRTPSGRGNYRYGHTRSSLCRTRGATSPAFRRTNCQLRDVYTPKSAGGHTYSLCEPSRRPACMSLGTSSPKEDQEFTLECGSPS